MKQKQQILPVLPFAYTMQAEQAAWNNLEEIRIGTGRPMFFRYADRELQLGPAGEAAWVEELIRRACRQSVYACNDTIRKGYVTIPGGHRIGLCGTGVVQQGSVQTIRSPSSVVIRVAREVPGCADPVFPKLHTSALILGPPGSGKTTLLRDLIRKLSDQRSQWVGLADERAEVSAMTDGGPQLCVGRRTDILTQIEKAEAVMMLLRTMSPQWIAMDEVTAPKDVQALEQAAHCGVRLLATVHGSKIEDLQQRSLYRNLLESGVFRTVIVLQADKTCSVEEIVR